MNTAEDILSGDELVALTKGALVTVRAGDRANAMTVSWGHFGFMWQRPVATIVIRKSRFTHDLLETTSCFSITIPSGSPKEILSLCGSASGRDTDKLAALGLKIRKGQALDVVVLDIPGIHYECRVLLRNEMERSRLAPSIAKQFYDDGDYHTFYVAEIAAKYRA